MTRKSKLIITIIEVVVLLAALAAILFWVMGEKKEMTVYDFARDIQYRDGKNYIMTDEDIVEGTILAADMNDSYITSRDQIVNKYLNASGYKGTHILKNQLQDEPTYISKQGASDLAEFRKIYLSVDLRTAFAGDIQSGSIVDLVFIEKSDGLATEETENLIDEDERYLNENNHIKYAQAKIFMQNVPIYQVYTASGAVYTRKITDPETLQTFHGELSTDGEQQQDTGEPAFVALAVTAEQYEEIVSRMQMGTVSIVSRFTESVNTDTEGYLVIKTDSANIYAGKGSLEFDPEMLKNELLEEGEVTEPVIHKVELPGVYSFFKDLAKIQMTDEQKNRYNAIYTKYCDYMEDINGENWEAYEPDIVTMDRIKSEIDTTDDAQIARFTEFKSELESLAKDLKGNDVILPW